MLLLYPCVSCVHTLFIIVILPKTYLFHNSFASARYVAAEPVARGQIRKSERRCQLYTKTRTITRASFSKKTSKKSSVELNVAPKKRQDIYSHACVEQITLAHEYNYHLVAASDI